MSWLVTINIPRWERKECKNEIYDTKADALERQKYVQDVLHLHAEVMQYEKEGD